MTDDELITNLLRQLRSADPNVRCEAAGALGALGGDGAAAVCPLLDTCRDPDEHVRGEAAHSLWELAASCVGAVPEAERLLVAGVPLLVSLLDDPSEDVRGSAVGVLERLGPLGAPALPRLRELTVGGSRHQSETATRAIRAITGA
jgi:HEAT repeat protein